ncbi:MAG: hypothetical protein EX271_03005 [Acidimicrobiales bacterium]|nr:hypothetical protein [Hyphomonadaceae bacterium]RZV43853.1 MAG: hypothetical protein EX271_03005 [Acidimicrobiales bacterium]
MFRRPSLLVVYDAIAVYTSHRKILGTSWGMSGRLAVYPGVVAACGFSGLPLNYLVKEIAMKKSTLTLTLLATVLVCGTAQAESFTYEATQTSFKTIGGVGPDGTQYVGGYAEGESTAVREDGRKTKSTFVCVSTSQPPNAKIFDYHMMCDITEGESSFSAVFGCQINSEDGSESSCVGGMTGKTGDYAGRRGNVSSYGKDGTSKGSGQWFD